MALQVCLAGNSLYYPEQLWPYLNWALSLQAAGCRVVWLETVEPGVEETELGLAVRALTERLRRYALQDALALVSATGQPVELAPAGALPFEAAVEADVLIDLSYLSSETVACFRRSVFVDLDPGEAQIWAANGDMDISGRDLYISIGEGVGSPDRPFPDAGVSWLYVPTPVALDAWAPTPSAPGAPYTTISHWWYESSLEIDGEWVENSKQMAFEPFLGLPALTSARLELALGGLGDEGEQRRLEDLGWSIRDAAQVAATPETYRDYVLGSRGEFSAAKAPYVRLETGWLNDRTASYLAAGKPAVVQRTLAQRHSSLPDEEGLLRFDTVEQAAAALAAVESDYDRHARRAREIAEEHFDGRRIATRVLELALG
ncbi:MAG TPA: hypothetical protein VGY32_00595 [Solirubrobacteraceae bacterium]|jgi:hypothetical protein|nr:hypothetical protein [Solirubrobacteraceae bacterium]